MSEQVHEKTFTVEEVKTNLIEAIEMQKLQTELQELRTRMVTAKANEILAISKINEMVGSEKSQPEPKHSKQEQEFNMSNKTPESTL